MAETVPRRLAGTVKTATSDSPSVANPTRESYVALFGLLGFSERVRSQEFFLPIDLLSALRVRLDKVELPECKILQFSDTVLAYTQGVEVKNLEETLSISERLSSPSATATSSSCDECEQT